MAVVSFCTDWKVWALQGPPTEGNSVASLIIVGEQKTGPSACDVQQVHDLDEAREQVDLSRSLITGPQSFVLSSKSVLLLMTWQVPGVLCLVEVSPPL